MMHDSNWTTMDCLSEDKLIIVKVTSVDSI